MSTAVKNQVSITIEDVTAFFDYMETLRDKQDECSKILYAEYITQIDESYFVQNFIHEKYLDKIHNMKETISDLRFTLGKLERN